MKDILSQFGFRELPFTCELDVKKFFNTESMKEARDFLVSTVKNGMCAAVVGPAGTGKTFLTRALRRSLPEARYRIHYVKVAGLSKRDMCREICLAVGAQLAGTVPKLVRNVQDRLQSIVDVDALRPVILLDEAQELRPEVLAILKVLTNFEMDSRLVVSFILVGQNRLVRTLERYELEDISQRLSHFVQLQPMSREQSTRYLKHRCTIVGARKFPFDDDASTAIYDIARGNFRATDKLALKSLEVAYKEKNKTVDDNHVTEARRLLCL
jgi:general secretion pathway protein A